MASCGMQPANQNESQELARVAQQVAERSSKILGDFAQKQTQSMSAAVRDEMGIAKAFMDLYARLAGDPALLASMSMNLWVDQWRLWQSSWMKMLGMESHPVAEPAKGDWRFKDEEWSKNFLFDYIKQSYLIAARHIQEAVGQVDGLSPESEKKVAFFTRQYVDALAPSNFLMTNPQVLRETLSSGGQNLVRGLNNLLADIEKGGGQLRISMTDETAFHLGRNVATSPGKVVFQTDLMQLIQYQPSTSEVYRRPLIIIPPWINKYYILDLREKNSFIRWAVERGHTVFVLSWVNPDAKLAQKGFDDYMVEGPLAAMDFVARATGQREVNFIGYCLGGTLLGATLGYLAAKGDDRVKSATYFVSLLDFSQPGELGVFIDEQQVESLEKKMNERGYLEGSEMASTFNLLRANDLVWSFVVNNYLMGKDPFPFDLLYWNADSTRMPARMHSYYLRNMYLKNVMGVPGGLELKGVPIDLSKVKMPSYFISTVEDHIAPWKTTYKGSRYLGGPVRFVLGGSGHIAGIVNPPAAKKYQYWTNEARPETADEWFATAKQTPGSWWDDW
ncbi:MAG: class I poly(R)-hydroxyalkanoic acid synthase, partial [Betaproteobacteria bacterium]|nr:class I poly(R)-hydroxyalkanoic acid synthase [Betaproteobacteria bacterium]